MSGHETREARAEERIRELALLFGVPDGGRYLNDWKARASRLSELEQALREAVAEIEGSPYQSEPWGWGIAYRIDKWRALAGSPAEKQTLCRGCGGWSATSLLDCPRCSPAEKQDGERECEHKWRDYEGIGSVCRDCGAPEPSPAEKQEGGET